MVKSKDSSSDSTNVAEIVQVVDAALRWKAIIENLAAFRVLPHPLHKLTDCRGVGVQFILAKFLINKALQEFIVVLVGISNDWLQNIIDVFHFAYEFVFEGKLLDLIVAVCFVEECLSQEIHIIRILLVESLAECIRLIALVAYNPHTLTVIVKHRWEVWIAGGEVRAWDELLRLVLKQYRLAELWDLVNGYTDENQKANHSNGFRESGRELLEAPAFRKQACPHRPERKAVPQTIPIPVNNSDFSRVLQFRDMLLANRFGGVISQLIVLSFIATQTPVQVQVFLKRLVIYSKCLSVEFVYLGLWKLEVSHL